MSPEPVASRPRMQGYGIPEDGKAGPMSWADAEARLRASRNYWICSTRPDGRPHAMPVWGVWHAGALYFGTGKTSVKARNLAANPAVTVHLESGDDVVVVEGEARVTADASVFPALDRGYQEKYGMTLSEAGGDALILEVHPHRAFAWQETDFPDTATRWDWPTG